MGKKVVNKPRVSKWIGGMYILLTVFISVLFIGVVFGTRISSSPIELKVFFFSIMVFVLFLMGFTAFSLYRTRYVILDGALHSWSPFAVIDIKLKDIKKIERTRVPFHLRFGASLYCGMFYIPGLGWTRSIITNLTDGVLITAKDKRHYLITPSNPDGFAKLLKK